MGLISVKDKVILVTGATRGIGRAVAEAYLKEGAIVYGTGSSASSIERISGSGINAMVADVKQPGAVREVIDEIRKEHGILHCLVNNAGISSKTPASSFKEDEMEDIINTNFKGLFRACQAYYKAQKKDGGNIINVASVLGFVGTPLASIYSGTKGAVVQLTRNLAIEWVNSGFRVNAICPGFIETDMTEAMRSRDSILEAALSGIPMKKLGKPEDLAGAAIFLASDASSYMTGQFMIIDGGMTSW